LFAALFTTMLEAHDQRHMDKGTEVRTIKIRTEKVNTTDFDLKPEDSDALYERGREGAKWFFECWHAIGSFSGYVAKYRQPTS
jgi:NTE family protein